MYEVTFKTSGWCGKVDSADAAVSPLWGPAGTPDLWRWFLCHCLAWIPRAAADGDVINKVHSLYVVQWTTFRACYWFAALPRLLVSSQRRGQKSRCRWWIVAFVENILQFLHIQAWYLVDKPNKIKSAAMTKKQTNMFLVFQFHYTVH